MSTRKSLIVGVTVLACAVSVAALAGGELAALIQKTRLISGIDVLAPPQTGIARLPSTTNFELVDHKGGLPCALSTSGSLACAGYGCDLLVIDTSIPEEPRIVSKLSLLSPIRQILMDGDRVYVADGRGGLRLIDIKDRKVPREISSFGYRTAVRGVAVNGDTAYLAAGSGGLQIVDLSAADNPRLRPYKDRSATDGEVLDATALAVTGEHLCLVDGGKLKLMDLSDPERPRLLDAVEHGLGSDAVLSTGGALVALAGTRSAGALSIYRQADKRLEFASRLELPHGWGVNSIAMIDDRIYVAGSEGVMVVRLLAGKPVIESLWTTSSAALAVAPSFGSLVATCADGSLLVLATSEDDKGRLCLAGQIEQPGRVVTVSPVVDGGLLVGATRGIFSYKSPLQKRPPEIVNDRARPRFIASSGSITAVLKRGGSGVASERDWLEIYDPSARSARGNRFVMPVPGSSKRPVFTKNLVATGGYEGLYTVALPLDRHRPNNGFLPLPGGVTALAASGDLLFVGTRNTASKPELRIYDCSNPEHISPLASLPQRAPVEGLCARDDRLFATVGAFPGSGRLRVFRVSRSGAKVFLAPLNEIGVTGATAVELDRDLVYVQESARIAAFDLSGGIPSLAGTIDTTAAPMRLVDMAARDGLLYLASEEAGLYVYRFDGTRKRVIN